MKEEKTNTVPTELHGLRLDACLAQMEAQLTRSKAKTLIEEGAVSINAVRARKPSQRVAAGDVITFVIKKTGEPAQLTPRPIPLDILYEDESIIVINKPAGLCVYPGAGKEEETLVHGLLHHFDELAQGTGSLRPGIVHRLDKDTSGIMVVAKSDHAHACLGQAFKERAVKKKYLAICRGYLKDLHGTIDLPIGRHPLERKKMSTVSRAPRHAITHWEVIEELKGATFLQVEILTGRTHQIRVHMAATGHPLLGDRLYGGPMKLTWGQKAISIARQMLHAHTISFRHPKDKRWLEFTAPIPGDMEEVLRALRQ